MTPTSQRDWRQRQYVVVDLRQITTPERFEQVLEILNDGGFAPVLVAGTWLILAKVRALVRYVRP